MTSDPNEIRQPYTLTVLLAPNITLALPTLLLVQRPGERLLCTKAETDWKSRERADKRARSKTIAPRSRTLESAWNPRLILGFRESTRNKHYVCSPFQDIIPLHTTYEAGKPPPILSPPCTLEDESLNPRDCPAGPHSTHRSLPHRVSWAMVMVITAKKSASRKGQSRGSW